MAKELGLIDEIGGINEAIKAASEKANITEYTIKYYPEETDPFTNLLQTGKDNYIKNQLKQSTGEYYNYLQIINRLKHAHPIQAHMGYYPNL
jgi:protease-4